MIKYLMRIAVVLLSLGVSVASAYEWEGGSFELFEADINSDGYSDVLIRAPRSNVLVSIPYEIDIPVEQVAAGAKDVILYGQADGEYVMDFNPMASLVGDDVWNPSGWVPSIMSPVVEDFDGDGKNDLLVPALSDNARVVLLKSTETPIPTLTQTHEQNSLPVGALPSRGGLIFESGNAGVLDGEAYVGALDGTFSVTPTGKANYYAPIRLLPSVGGVVPSISLVYGGSNGNGVYGAGWYLSGLSKIERCPALLDREGYVDGVNFNNNDQYCINGSVLIAVSGSYGLDKTEYRTENESFSKIVSYGVTQNGPQYFRVWKKTGEIETYGGVPSSRLEKSNSTAAHSWFVSKIEDREGNYAEINYSSGKSVGGYSGCAAGNDELLLCSIEYTGNGSLVPSNSLRFEYESRSDVAELYSEGIKRVTRKRVAKIESYLGGDLVRYYELTYRYGDESRVSQLYRLSECLADNKCLKPTTFDWIQGVQDVTFTLQNSQGFPPQYTTSYDDSQSHMADVNGDGRADLIFTYRDGDSLGWTLYTANEDGKSFAFRNSGKDSGYRASLAQDNEQGFQTGDVNGDGKSDLIWVARNQTDIFRVVYLANSSGSGFVSQGYKVHSNSDFVDYEQGQYMVGDVNGDGRSDLVWAFAYGNKLGVATYHAVGSNDEAHLIRANFFSDSDFSTLAYQNKQFTLGDVNGDGKSDLIFAFTYESSMFRVVYLAKPNGAGFIKVSVEKDGFASSYDSYEDLSIHSGDTNGDDRQDLAITYRTGGLIYHRLYLATERGTNFKLVSTGSDKPSSYNTDLYEHHRFDFSDINGDGRADLLLSYSVGSAFGWASYIANFAGNALVADRSGAISVGNNNSNYREFVVGDLNADSKVDLVAANLDSSDNLYLRPLLLPTTYPDHINRIVDGFGNETLIDYQYLADARSGDVYSKGVGAQYPLRDDNGLSYVVSKVQQSDGIGGLRTFTYKYEAARTHLRGRGFMGFAKRTVTDQAKGLVTTETYRQDYPFNGMTATVLAEDSSGNDIEKTFNHWMLYAYGAGASQRNYVFLKDSAAIKYNPGTTTPLFAGVTINSFEQTYGNLTQEIKVVGRNIGSGIDGNYSTSGSFSAASFTTTPDKTQTTDYTYNNNATDWRIGFVTSQTLTVAKPGETDRSVTNTYTPWSTTSFLKASETLFDGSAIEQTITYASRDAYGNPLRIETVGKDYDGSATTTQVTTYGPYVDGLYPQWQRNTYNHQTDLEYDPVVGQVTRTTDPNDLVVDTLYDDFGRNVYKKLADGTDITTTYAYCGASCPSGAVYYTLTRVTRSGTQGKPDSLTYYDTFDRVIQTRTQDFSGSWVYSDTEYDNLGRIERTSVPYYQGETPTYTQFAYDFINRVEREDKPNGGWVTSTFAPGGDGVITHTVTDNIIDPVNGNRSTTTTKHLNAQNLVVTAVDDANTPTHFEYDVWDNLRWVQVNNDAATAINISFNDAGMKTLLDDPDAGVIQYQYDSFGNTRREIYNPGASQEIVTSEYDALNRLTARYDTVSGTTTQSGQWDYDTRTNGIGKLAAMSGPDVQQDYYYDGLSRVQEKRTTLLAGTPRSFHYRYDGFSRLQQVAYPGGLTLQNAYNSIGFLDTVTNLLDSKTLWDAASGDKWGNVTQFTLGNGLTTQRSYNPATGLISTIQTGAVQNNSYQFDSSGNLVQRNFNVGNSLVENFTYDGLNRLQTAVTSGLSGGTRTLDYDYDPLGNIKTKSGVSDVNGYHYDKTNNAGPHAVTRTVLAGTTTNYGYDAKGNMTANGSKTLGYTLFNKPDNIVDAATGSAIDFKYGPDRRRFYQRKLESGTVTETLYYNSGNYEIVKEGNKLRQKAYVGDYLVYQSLLAGTDINQPAVDVGKKYTYLHRDNLGSTDAVTDGNGALVTRNLFDPFGLRRNLDGNNATPAYLSTLAATTYDTTTRGYTGHEQLDAVGLIHMNGRVYDPTLGRFLSTDQYVQYPHFSQSYNRYTYVLNNPLSYNDPGGEIIPVLVWGAVAAWRAYSAYDTVTTAIENYDTITDPNASNLDKGLAILDTGSSIVVPKFIREAGKSAGAGVKAVGSKMSDAAKKLKTKVDAPNGPKPNANQADNALTSKAGSGGCNCCFIGGTLVLTKDGYKAIDQLQLGDLVASKNEETGEVDWKPVTETFIYDDDRITWQLTLKGQDSIQEFEVTDNHPFWVLGAGWVEVQDLAAGMKVTTFADTGMEVVEVTPLERSPITYNIEVADFHTFFVGEEKVWVHNQCGCGVSVTTTVDPDSVGPVIKVNVKQTVDTSKIPDVEKIAKDRMLGANGVKTASKTLWKGKGSERIDVENPNPGQRPGQVHYQDNDNNKYLYDPETKTFPDAPKSVNEKLGNEKFKAAIDKAMTKYLGESNVGNE